jgi:hypothetical protein
MLTRDWAVGPAVELLSLAQGGSQHSRRDAAPLAAGCAISANSVVPELILFGRRVPVDMGLAVVGIGLTLSQGIGIPDVVVNM